MNSLVYASPVYSDDALVARTAVVAGDIREMSGVFANVRQSLRRRSMIYSDNSLPWVPKQVGSKLIELLMQVPLDGTLD
ncbi:hypothetical protein TNCV_1837781 [Trichonephila clavipes]|nr:hypothetical protein TNCV_1837781 [Trichonephila clavipes]